MRKICFYQCDSLAGLSDHEKYKYCMCEYFKLWNCAITCQQLNRVIASASDSNCRQQRFSGPMTGWEYQHCWSWVVEDFPTSSHVHLVITVSVDSLFIASGEVLDHFESVPMKCTPGIKLRRERELSPSLYFWVVWCFTPVLFLARSINPASRDPFISDAFFQIPFIEFTSNVTLLWV